MNPPDPCHDFVRQEIDRLRSEMTAATREFIISQTDGLRLQLEKLEEESVTTRSEVAVMREGFMKLQVEMRKGLADLKDVIPSAELMVKIKQMVTSAKEMRATTRTAVITTLVGGTLLALWEGLRGSLKGN